MPPVRLLHPVPVMLRKADRVKTAVMDPILHEPVGQIRHKQKPIRLVAQIKIGKTDDPNPSEGGTIEESDGYLLFRTQDLRAKKVTVERGDRVIQIGDGDNAREVDYYITKLLQMGHYPDHGGSSLVRCYFEDRHPSRLRSDS